MVLNRHEFSWRDDVRGVLTVLGFGIATLVGLTLLMAAVLLLSGAGLPGLQ